MKKLTENFQQFKKTYNSDIIKIYKNTKALLQKYETKMRKYNVPLEDSGDEKVFSQNPIKEDQVEVKKPKKEPKAEPKKKEETEYEVPAKVINQKPNVKAGTIALKRKRQVSPETESEYEDNAVTSKTRNENSNVKKRDAIVRGEAIEVVKKRGRPKMTSNEKTDAREKRK